MELIIKELDFGENYYDYCCLLKQLTKISPENVIESQFISHLHLIKSNPLHKIIIAKLGWKIVGSTTILIEPKFIHDLSFVGHIEDVVVEQAYRSNGVGQKLIEKAIEICRDHRCYKIILDCSEKNMEFYKKFGFEQKEFQLALYLDKSA